MWVVALLAYAVAVFHRASLGVAGLAAQDRFDAGASAISLFVVLQLVVYAGLQVPVGMALDRLGSRRMILLGALTMAAGQLVLALADDVPTAVAARVLVGAGDAMTFISVLRLVSLWFPGGRVAVVTQLTGLLGQAGQVVAAYPLVALLGSRTWGATFAGAAAVGVLVAVLVAVAVRDVPPGTEVAPPQTLAQVRGNLHDAWHEPGTRLGLYTHLSTQFSATVFGLLWGFPFLTVGQGLEPGTAAALLTLLVVSGMVFGPVIGQLCGRWPLRRSVLVFGILAATATVWTAVLAWPGRAPLPLLVLLVLVLSTQRARLDDRLRLRAHGEPGRAAGQRQRRRQRRRLRGLPAAHARHRAGARRQHPGSRHRLLARVVQARLRAAVRAVAGRPGRRRAAPARAARPPRDRRRRHRTAARRRARAPARLVGVRLSARRHLVR